MEPGVTSCGLCTLLLWGQMNVPGSPPTTPQAAGTRQRLQSARPACTGQTLLSGNQSFPNWSWRWQRPHDRNKQTPPVPHTHRRKQPIQPGLPVSTGPTLTPMLGPLFGYRLCVCKAANDLTSIENERSHQRETVISRDAARGTWKYDVWL